MTTIAGTHKQNRSTSHLIGDSCRLSSHFALVVAAAVVLAIVGDRTGEAWSGLVTVAWVVAAVGAAVAVLYLLVTLVAWAVYRRRERATRRPGAEIVEIKGRNQGAQRVSRLHRRSRLRYDELPVSDGARLSFAGANPASDSR